MQKSSEYLSQKETRNFILKNDFERDRCDIELQKKRNSRRNLEPVHIPYLKNREDKYLAEIASSNRDGLCYSKF